MDGLATYQVVKGDATEPQGEGMKMIIHCCNNKRKWGKGFVLALSRKWPQTQHVYFCTNMELGTISAVKVNDSTMVVNIIGQDGYGSSGCYVKYDALSIAFHKLRDYALKHNATVHGPKLGAGLAGGDWSIIEGMLKDILVKGGVSVTIYELN